jgi:hypothetical protein
VPTLIQINVVTIDDIDNIINVVTIDVIDNIINVVTFDDIDNIINVVTIDDIDNIINVVTIDDIDNIINVVTNLYNYYFNGLKKISMLYNNSSASEENCEEVETYQLVEIK